MRLATISLAAQDEDTILEFFCAPDIVFLASVLDDCWDEWQAGLIGTTIEDFTETDTDEMYSGDWEFE